jgi:hypothetical protein
VPPVAATHRTTTPSAVTLPCHHRWSYHRLWPRSD